MLEQYDHIIIENEFWIWNGNSASGATSTRELLNKKMDMNSEDNELYIPDDFSEALSDSEPT